MSDIQHQFGHSVEYAVLANPDGVYQFCDKYGFVPINEKDAVQNVLYIIASNEQAAEEFFMQIHPDADIYRELRKDAVAAAPANIAPILPDFTQYLEFRVTIKDIVLIGVMAFIASLIFKK